MGTTKDMKQYMAARRNAKQTKTKDEFGNKIVWTVICDSPYGESRQVRRHPYSFRCTLHTKKWTKARVNHYANIFAQATKMKTTKAPKEKKSFVRSLVNLFA